GALAVAVSGRDNLGGSAQGVGERWSEDPSAGALEYRQGVVARICSGEVLLAIPGEVPDRHRGTAAPACKGDSCILERAGAGVDEYPQCAAVLICDGQVRAAVGVEIPHRQRVRPETASGVEDRAGEAVGTVAEQHSDAVIARV